MKSQGLVREKNLGEVVSNHERALAKARGEARPEAAHGKAARPPDIDGAPSASIGDTGGHGRGAGGSFGHGRGR